MQKASHILILIDKMPAQGSEWLKSTVLDKLSPEKGGRPYRDCTDSKTRIEAVEVGPADFSSWAYVTMAASIQFMMIWNHQPDLDQLRWQQFTGRIGNGAVLLFLSDVGLVNTVEYFESPPPEGDGRCSDNECPCSETPIPRGQGFLYIPPEVVEMRRDARTLDALDTKMERALKHDKIAGAFRFGTLIPRQGLYHPILMCRQGAERRGIDLEVAAKDAAFWWESGLVPLRPTPSARTRKPKPEPDVADGRAGEQLTRQESVEKVDYQHIRRLLSRAPGSGGVDLVDMGGLEQTIIFDLEGGYTPTAEEVKLARQVRAFEVEGNQCMHSGRFEEAITYFEKAAQISRADGILYQNISVAYNRLGNLPKAREAIREALRREPDNARIQNNARAIGVSSYGSSEASLAQPAAPMAAPAIATDQKPRGKTNALAIASLVLGIITVIGGCANPIVGIPFAIGAFITGRIGSRRVKDSDGIQTGERLALAGMILGGAGLVLSLVSTAVLILAILVDRAS